MSKFNKKFQTLDQTKNNDKWTFNAISYCCLVSENTTLTFKQIANFCNLHEVEIQGIADGEVAKGIKPYNPIISGQLSREEIELSAKDESRPLNIKSNDIEISGEEKKLKNIYLCQKDKINQTLRFG